MSKVKAKSLSFIIFALLSFGSNAYELDKPRDSLYEDFEEHFKHELRIIRQASLFEDTLSEETMTRELYFFFDKVSIKNAHNVLAIINDFMSNASDEQLASLFSNLTMSFSYAGTPDFVESKLYLTAFFESLSEDFISRFYSSVAIAKGDKEFRENLTKGTIASMKEQMELYESY